MQRIHFCTLSVCTIAHISLILTHNPFISSPCFYLSSHLSALLRRRSKTCTPSLPSWLATLLSPPSLPPSSLPHSFALPWWYLIAVKQEAGEQTAGEPTLILSCAICCGHMTELQNPL